jgi:plastocyanin domain-containing protein
MKATIVSIVLAVLLIGGAFMFTDNKGDSTQVVAVDNVTTVNGEQIIEIKAKGGYQPRKSIAKAGMPTILRFDTNGTFDCSASVRISSLNISKVLPQSGVTDISIGVGQVGVLQGTCGMGMYPFEVDFQS